MQLHGAASDCKVCENLTNDVCDLGMTEIIDMSGPATQRSAIQHRCLEDIRGISLYGSEVNTSQNALTHSSRLGNVMLRKVVFLKPKVTISLKFYGQS